VNQTAPVHTGSKGTRILGAASLVGVLALLWFALVVSPAEENQGDAVRLMYIHVPLATLMFAGFGVTFLGSVMWLWRKSAWWDTVAFASAEVGVVFTGLCLVTGMVWGKPTWGVYWTWDARLTSTALLFLLYVGYLAVRNLNLAPNQRNKISAWVAILAFVDVPIVHYSVDWWRSLHQSATITRINPTIDGMMLFSLMLGFVVFAVLYSWLLMHRFRLAWLEEQVAEHGLDLALGERRAEAETLAGAGTAAVAAAPPATVPGAPAAVPGAPAAVPGAPVAGARR
jgi:heme exporter protein C